VIPLMLVGCTTSFRRWIYKWSTWKSRDLRDTY